MSQPQITIKNDSEQMKNNYLVENNSKDTKNSTRHDKEIQSDDVNTKFNESLNDISRLTNQTRNDICLDCSKTEDVMNDAAGHGRSVDTGADCCSWGPVAMVLCVFSGLLVILVAFVFLNLNAKTYWDVSSKEQGCTPSSLR